MSSVQPRFETWSQQPFPICRLCVICAAVRVPGWNGMGRLGPSPSVSGCGCRPVCVACFGAIGGWLQLAPCLLCGEVCDEPGCSPLVEPRQPVAPGEPGGSRPPVPQWRRTLAAASCRGERHRYVDVPENVVAGFGVLPSRRVKASLSSSSSSSSGESSDPEWSPVSSDGPEVDEF